MNIEVSYNWIKDYLKTRQSAENFAKKLSLSGPAIERSYPQAPLFDRMFVGEVLEISQHPNADKLKLVRTGLGDRELELVCGGVNLSVGMKVAVAEVGASVRWHGEGEPIVLEPAKIRGVESRGMICGANEIGLADAFPHDTYEILDLSWCKAKPGTEVAKALKLEDTVFDIEVTTNRPDAFSVIGLAREASAILGDQFTWKEPVVPAVRKGTAGQPLKVSVAAPERCTRYQAIVLENICVGPSPWWLKNRLRLSGIRPINNVVDITNYVMLEYGQPMHAFDYHKLEGPEIQVRAAKAGESILLLDGNEKELQPDNLVIADAKRPIAVAGVMGGEETAVDAETHTIVLESATFDPVSVRRTARALNTHSDSSLRFEKGLPEEQTTAALARAVELCQEVACARVAGKPYDERSVPARKVKFPFRPAKAEALIGVKISRPQMTKILKSLGFTMGAPTGKGANRKYEVTVPYWRERDIEGERDFAEEIARVYGYHNLPSVIPSGPLPVEPVDPLLKAEHLTRHYFRGAGFTETFTYSFVSGELLEKCGFDLSERLRVANPLSEEFEYMRPSLLPGMLQVVADNEGLFPEGRLFEVSRVYVKQEGAELPDEPTRLTALVYGGRDSEARLREVRGLLEQWCDRLGISRPEIVPAADCERWHPGRAAKLVFGERTLGWLGEIHPLIAERLGLQAGVAGFQLNLSAVLAAGAVAARQYQPPSPFPPVRRDLAFVVPEAVAYGDLEKIVLAADPIIRQVELFDIYRGQGLGEDERSLAVHLELGRDDRTLTAEEADQVVSRIVKALEKQVNARIRG
jgi:phenylalanyl-tRNA synthetase beta chain